MPTPIQNRRDKFRAGLSTLYLPHYDLLCKLLPEPWAPYCGLRTFSQQDNLFAIGRKIAPLGAAHIVTDAKGGESPHCYGCASDWVKWVDEKPVWAKKDDPLWEEYVLAVRQAGLAPGADFHSRDMDHNELKMTASWKHILVTYTQRGMTAAQEHIERNLLA